MLVEAFGPEIEEALREYGCQYGMTALEVARYVLEDWCQAKGLLAVEEWDEALPPPSDASKQ